MHARLLDQIKRVIGDYYGEAADLSQWRDLLAEVSSTYEDYENTHNVLQQTLATTATEAVKIDQERKAFYSALPDMGLRVTANNTVLNAKLPSNSPLLCAEFREHIPVAELLNAEAYRQLAPALLEAQSRRQPQTCEIQLLLSEGLSSYDVRIYPVVRSEFVVLIADVSSRKLAEIQTRQNFNRVAQHYKAVVSLLHLCETSVDYDHLLQHICLACAQMLEADRVGVWLFDGDASVVACEVEYDASFKQFTRGHTQASAWYDAHSGDSRRGFGAARSFHTTPNGASSVSVQEPLRLAGQLVGFLAIAEARAPQTTADEPDFVAAAADLLAIVLQRRRSQFGAKRPDNSEVRFKTLAQLTKVPIFAFRTAIIYANQATESMTGFAGEALLLLPIGVVMGEGFAERFSGENLALAEEGQGTVLDIEFVNRSGDTRWATVSVSAVRFEGRLAWLASAVDITEAKRVAAQLHFQLFHDVLTGLPNRHGFSTAVEQCCDRIRRERQAKFAVLYVDLDGFKVVNERFGQELGDEFLLATGLRLRTLLPVTQLIARMASDEFAVLLPEVESTDEMLRIAQELLAAVSKPFVSGKWELVVTACVGMAVGDRHDEATEGALRRAEIAMHQAKARGKQSCALYDMRAQAKAIQLVEVERELRMQWRNGTLQLQLSPIADLESGAAAGFVAGIYLPLEKYPDVSASDFRQLLTDSYLARRLEDWTLHAAAQRVAELPSQACMFVSFAAASLANAGVIESVNALLGKCDFSSGQVGIQLCADQLATAIQHNPQLVSNLQRLACPLVLDNFTGGLGALHGLAELPIHMLKLDASLVSNLHTPKGQAIIQSLIALGAALDCRVVVNLKTSVGSPKSAHPLGAPSKS